MIAWERFVLSALKGLQWARVGFRASRPSAPRFSLGSLASPFLAWAISKWWIARRRARAVAEPAPRVAVRTAGERAERLSASGGRRPAGRAEPRASADRARRGRVRRARAKVARAKAARARRARAA